MEWQEDVIKLNHLTALFLLSMGSRWKYLSGSSILPNSPLHRLQTDLDGLMLESILDDIPLVVSIVLGVGVPTIVFLFWIYQGSVFSRENYSDFLFRGVHDLR